MEKKDFDDVADGSSLGFHGSPINVHVPHTMVLNLLFFLSAADNEEANSAEF